MVKVGEETGKLNETFDHLANYLNRQYALTAKTRNALIYPVFVICTFYSDGIDVCDSYSKTFCHYS